jgi:hypothetical protein
LYEYVLEDPINRTDPRGESEASALWNYILSVLTSWGIDVGQSAVEKEQPSPSIAIEAIPGPDALPGLTGAEQIALDADNSLDICSGIRALLLGGGTNLQRANAAANTK